MDELELRDYFRVLLQRKFVVIAALALGVGVAIALTAATTPLYESKAKLFLQRQEIVRLDELDAAGQGENGPAGGETETRTGRTTAPPQIRTVELSQELLRTYGEVMATTPVAERAVESAKLPIDATDLAEGLKAEPVLETQILAISYRHRDPSIARRAVNATADAFRDEVLASEGPIEPGGGAGLRVSVVQPALLPGRPVTPRPRQNLALGLLLGLVSGSGLAFLLEYFDRSIKNKKDVADHLGLPVLATIPRIRRRERKPYLGGADHSAFAEAFRKLKTTIQLRDSGAPRTILITSTRRGEGTTTAALNLAATYANADTKTVLVEADLRYPQLHEVFPTGERKGIAAVLRDETSVDAALLDGPVRGLSFLPAVHAASKPVELLASRRMIDVLEELRRRFETIVIDTPPILPTADASTLAPLADGVVIVARMNETDRDKLTESAQLIDRIGAHLLGVVITDTPGQADEDRPVNRLLEDRPA